MLLLNTLPPGPPTPMGRVSTESGIVSQSGSSFTTITTFEPPVVRERDVNCGSSIGLSTPYYGNSSQPLSSTKMTDTSATQTVDSSLSSITDATTTQSVNSLETPVPTSGSGNGSIMARIMAQ